MRRFGTIAAAAVIAAGLLAAPAHASAAAVRVPPALLPWGTPAQTAADVAKMKHVPADPSPAATARAAALSAPKGRPGGAAKQSLLTTAYFNYCIGSQAAVTTGAYGNSVIGKPTIMSGAGHSLGEISVQHAVGGLDNLVEIGWSVEPAVNGDSNPHLFGYWWKNGVGMGYNASPGYTDYPAASGGTINLGDTLLANVGTAKKFGIEFSGGAWWLAYDNVWVGYYLELDWTGTTLGGATVTGGFHDTTFVQYFGEVAATTATPTSQMGTGVLGSTSATAPISSRWSGATYINGPAVDLYVHNQPSNPTKYNVAPYGTAPYKSFGFGGPGW